MSPAPADDEISLGRLIEVTDGFTALSVRMAMARALKDSGSIDAARPLDAQWYHSFYRAVISRLVIG